jgi:hypothetical protein
VSSRSELNLYRLAIPNATAVHTVDYDPERTQPRELSFGWTLDD